MKRRGRPVLSAISGFFSGLFIGLSLLFYGVIPLDSNLLVILPIAGLVIAWILAMWMPIPRRGATAMPATVPAAPPPSEPMPASGEGDEAPDQASADAPEEQ